MVSTHGFNLRFQLIHNYFHILHVSLAKTAVDAIWTSCAVGEGVASVAQDCVDTMSSSSVQTYLEGQLEDFSSSVVSTLETVNTGRWKLSDTPKFDNYTYLG